MDLITHLSSPLGAITLASDGAGLIGLWFDGQKHFGRTLDSEWEERELPIFAETRRWLELYFSGELPTFTPPLSPRGTAFQLAVWRQLLIIPYGQTLTYGELARRLDCRSAQAIGGAVGRNPLSLLIPCHRVLGTGGAMTGYAGGLWRKEALLRLEGILPAGPEATVEL